jgi:hypothetical protein
MDNVGYLLPALRRKEQERSGGRAGKKHEKSRK